MPSSGPCCQEISRVWRHIRDPVTLFQGPVSACHLPRIWGRATKNLCGSAACQGWSVRERGAAASSGGNPSAFLVSPAPSQGPAHLPLPRDGLSASPCSCCRAPVIGTMLWQHPSEDIQITCPQHVKKSTSVCWYSAFQSSQQGNASGVDFFPPSKYYWFVYFFSFILDVLFFFFISHSRVN